MLWSLLYVSAQWCIRGCDRTSINGHYCCGHRWLIFGTGCLNLGFLTNRAEKRVFRAGLITRAMHEGLSLRKTRFYRHSEAHNTGSTFKVALYGSATQKQVKCIEIPCFSVFYPFFTKWHFINSNSSAYWINFKSNNINIFKSHAIEICV